MKKWGLRIAVVIVIGCLATTAYYISKTNMEEIPTVSELAIDIKPGSPKAVLQLHNGEMAIFIPVSSQKG